MNYYCPYCKQKLKTFQDGNLYCDNIKNHGLKYIGSVKNWKEMWNNYLIQKGHPYYKNKFMILMEKIMFEPKGEE